MDKDKVNGTIDDTVGRVKRQVGEWTGDTDAQLEGAAQQVKGKAEKLSGSVKDAVRDAARPSQQPDEQTDIIKDEHETVHRH